MLRLATFLVIAGVSVIAAAQPKSRAEQLFEEGRALAKKNDYAGACAKFEESFQLDAQSGTQVNLGDCLEKQGKIVRAWRMFDAAAERSKTDGNAVRAKFAADRAKKLEPKLATVIARVADPSTPGIVLVVAGESVPPAAEVRVRVEPGTIAVSVTATDTQPFNASIVVAAGASVDVAVPVLAPILRTPLPDTSPPKPAPVPPVTTVAPPSDELSPGPGMPGMPGLREVTSRDPTRVRVAYVLGGTGAALGITGIALAWTAKRRWNDAEAAGDIDRANDQLRLADVGTVLGISSVALIATSVVLYVSAKRTVAVQAASIPSGTGLAITGAF